MAEKKPAETAADRVPFETLIRGEYKEDFQKKVEEILRKRFKNQEKRREEPTKNEEKPAEIAEKPEKSEEKSDQTAPEPEEKPAGEQEAAEGRDVRDPRYERLLRSARAARRTYPQLDLREELRSPRFADMVLRGVDVKSAYEAVHHEEMLRSAMGYGVQRAAEKLSRARITGRPAENGAESQSASVERLDPRRMTAEERADIRRRVLERGEKVWF